MHQLTAQPPVPPIPAPGRLDRPAFQRRARLCLAAALIAAGAWTLRGFLPALAWAAILAVATWPLYRRAERRFPPGRHNVALPLLFTAVVALGVLVPLALAAIQLGREAHLVFEIVDQARVTGIPVPDWIGRLPVAGEAARTWWAENLADPAGSAALIERMSHGSLAADARALGGQLIRRAVVFGFTLVTLFFLYRDGERLGRGLRRASHRAVGPHGERIARQMIASVHGTVDGLVLVGLGVGAIMGVSYWFAGVPHPTLFGAATAIAAMIPFAAPVVFGICSLVLLANGSAAAAAGVFVFGSVVMFVADHFVRPILIGGATRLPFLWVLLGILGGVEAWELLGLFLGPALLAALVMLWRDWTGTPAPGEAEASDGPARLETLPPSPR
ncbi:MAG: AI-2E family transporter [Methylobacteriaceae bacterium]|nr:AI-2E family transporter [Methylobacteriaceae bacterium]